MRRYQILILNIGLGVIVVVLFLILIKIEHRMFPPMDQRVDLCAWPFFVVGTFILIYLLIGFLIDAYIDAGHYPQAPLSQIFYALFTFKLLPKATFITGLIAVVSLWIAFAFHDKLILLGSDYREITPENAANMTEKMLYHVVEEMKISAGLSFMPKVYIIQATWSKSISK